MKKLIRFKQHQLQSSESVEPQEESIKKWTFREAWEWVANFPIIKAFRLEGQDSKEMMRTFSILLMEKLDIEHRQEIPTAEEVQEAIRQLKDVPKMMPFCALLLMPIPGVLTSYTFIAFLLYRLSGGQINMLPDKFNVVMDELGNKKIFSFLKKKRKKDSK